MGTKIKYLRRSKDGAAGDGLSRCREILVCPTSRIALPKSGVYLANVRALDPDFLVVVILGRF
jgi:hypothetical protein